VLAAVAMAGALAPGAQAATWSEIPSGTTEDITAVEYQGPGRFWFATGAGNIFTRAGDAFVKTGSAPGVVFRDIEFQDGGLVGFAVGTNGGVLRSADGGASWVPVAGIAGGQQTVVNDCAAGDQVIGDVDSVRFAGSARAWLAGGGNQLYRTVDGATAADVGAIADGWQLANDNGVTCRIPTDVDDLFPVPGSSSVYFASKALGAIFFSSNALATTATPKLGVAGLGTAGTRRLTGDPASPNRQWAVSSGGAGAAFVARTSDGWSTAAGWTIANPARGAITTPESVDFNGGTVAAAGSAGMIAESIDGAAFYADPAAGAEAADWRSVSLASPAAGAIAGAGGRLVVTANANVIPVVAGATGAPAASAPSAVSNPPGSRGVALVVTPPPRSASLPAFGFQKRTQPPVAGGVAHKDGRFVVLDVFGAFRVPAGVRDAAGCRGRVLLTVSRTTGRRRDLTEATTSLSRTCTYAKRIRVRRSRVGARKSLKLRVAFKGNAVVRASSVTYTVSVR